MKFVKIIFLFALTGFGILLYNNLMAFRDGIVGFTKKGGNEVGCVCHQFEPNDTVSVVISGPSSVAAGDTAIYKLKISNGPAIAGGCDISTSLGRVITSPIDTSLKSEEPVVGAGFELTHKRPKFFSGDTLEFVFSYIAPITPNVTDTLFANGNSTNNDTTSDNDKWNYAENLIINVVPPSSISNATGIVKSFELEQNYPNPFNPETRITFNLKKASEVSLSVYNQSGKLVSEIISNNYFTSGSYTLTFNANQFDLSSGVYFYKLSSGEYTDVKKMMLIK